MICKEVSDRIRGCLLGGAAGDALGYPVEFLWIDDIRKRYGPGGIQRYDFDGRTGKALISDDTQMTLFTAEGILSGLTQNRLNGTSIPLRKYVESAYADWLSTQRLGAQPPQPVGSRNGSRLLQYPELYSRRAPGNTCLSALAERPKRSVTDFIAAPLNNSKGCGGVMRVAPAAMLHSEDIRAISMEGAQIAAITHSHPLGYLPAAMLTDLLNRIVYRNAEPQSLLDLVRQSQHAIAEQFAGTPKTETLLACIDRAVQLAQEPQADDLENITALGGGWVAEETLAIAVYCSLRHADDFSAALTATVNHDGDSDSTGAVTGNILGAWLGFDAIEGRWKTGLELYDVLMELADDLCIVQQLPPDTPLPPGWIEKYARS